jgi:myo-inositol-1(or 4)-monophosphatase
VSPLHHTDSASRPPQTSASQRAEFSAMALLVAEEAATLVAAGYRSRPRPDRKGRHDLVTEFDRASEGLLVARLASLAPGIPVVGEQASRQGTQASPGLVWYVDPLDGTTNFVHGHPFWCVAVGLMEDDRPAAGAVVAPLLAVRWHGHVDPIAASGQRAGAALRNGAPCSVSGATDLDDALVATGFPAIRDRAPQNNFDSFIAVKRAAQAVRRCGSAAIDLCMVADGTYDAYWERSLHVWDTAAASAIVLAAGGAITALDGGSPDYHVGNLVASNGLLHRAMLETLRS